MASKVEIANRALSRLGAQRITSFSDSTVPAKLINSIYEQVAESTMGAAEWSTATTRTTLTQLAAAPAWGFDYQYQLPTDPLCLKVQSVNENKAGDVIYKIEGDRLLTDDTTVKIKYTKYIDNSENYGVYLTDAIVWALVAEMAYPIMGQNTAADRLIEKAEAKIMQLAGRDSTQGSADQTNSDTFIDTRYD